MNEYLKQKMKEFDRKYGDMEIDYCEYTGFSKEEILDGYEDFEDWRQATLDYILNRHGARFEYRITHLDYREVGDTIIMDLSLSAEKMVEHDGFDETDKEEIDDYFDIDESDFLGW